MMSCNLKNVVRITVFMWLFLPVLVSAQTAAPGDINSALNSFTGETGASTQNLTDATGAGIELAYQLTGLIFFIMALYGGIRWMTSQGDEAVVTKGRDTLVGATIGLVVVVSAYGISSFITSRATADLSSNGNQSSLEAGAGTEDTPEFDESSTVTGCCVYRVSRTNRNRASVQTNSSAGCQQVSEATGVDSDEGDDWHWLEGVDSAETCSGVAICLGRALERNQISCLSNLAE